MPEINRGNLYNVDDLIDRWKCGWRALAQLGESLLLPGSIQFSNCPPIWDLSHQISDGFCEIYSHIVQRPGSSGHMAGEMFLALAATPKNQPFGNVDERHETRFVPQVQQRTRSGKDEIARRRFVGRVTNAFANSTTVEEAFSKIGTVKQRKEFIESCSGSSVQKDMAAKIRGHWAKAMKWLDYGLKNEAAWEEAYWNCIWCYLEPHVEVMKEIEDRIANDVPLTYDQYNLLNKYMSSGYPQGYRFEYASGEGETYKLVLAPAETINKTFDNLATDADQFLAQPAFGLAGELQRRCSKARFVRQCRAPSCGKRFYTGRNDATACPGSQAGKKNKCSLEWNQYKRYLHKIKIEDVEESWNDSRLKEQFLSR
jgi:hypothetical protein